MFEVGARGEEVLICLQQEDRRVRRKHGGGENLPIGFEVLKVRLLQWSNVNGKICLHLTSCSGGVEPIQSGAAGRGEGGQLGLHGLS